MNESSVADQVQLSCDRKKDSVDFYTLPLSVQYIVFADSDAYQIVTCRDVSLMLVFDKRKRFVSLF